MRKFKKLVKDSAKNSIEKIVEIRYHQSHKNEAFKALQNIEQDTGFILTDKQKKLINDYSIEILGSKVYAYWLYVYTAFKGEFSEGWIPDNYYDRVVLPKINKDYRNIATIKTLSKKLVGSDLFPDKFYLIDGNLYDENYNIISFKELYDEIESGSELFIKKDESHQGKGVLKLHKGNFNKEAIQSFGNSVIQEAIIQHPWFDSITPESVATIRITTTKETDGSTKMRAGYLRVGTGDNQFVQSSTAIKIPIIDQDGSLDDYGVDPNWRRIQYHPDTGFVFANKKIPYFSKAVKVCEKLHQKIPHFTIIGWDISITENGDIKIIELNARHPGIKFSEASTGPCFADLNWQELWKQAD